MSEHLQFVVERLNEPPFQMGLTLVAFDEKTPFELLEIVNGLMAHLSAEHRIDLRDETPEATANRMLNFLQVMNYKMPLEGQTAKQALLHGDPQLIYPILTWMLQRMPELQKRAYLSRFLVSVEVPEHMFTDEEVIEVYQTYKDLQEEFKEVHKTSEKYKSQLISPHEIKKAILQMEEDKGQLEQKVEALQSKLESTERFEEMLQATHGLRLQQDEQVKLQDRLAEQKALLLQAEHKLNGLVQTIHGKQAADSSADTGTMLQRLEREVHEMEHTALEVLPMEIQAKQRRMDELQQMLSEPTASDGELQQMAQQQQQLLREVAALEERRRAGLNNPDDKLALFRQQASLVAKKREQLHARLNTVGRERAEVEGELSAKAADLESIKGKPVLKGEEFRKYANELRSKTAQWKRMKTELSELRAEWGVLSRTEAILTEQDAAISAVLGEAEARRGVEGFQQTQDELEKVSQLKAEVDEEKGKTLESISKVVEEINGNIKARKNRLAPQIKELRTLRATFQELEAEYLERKAAYDNTKAGLESNFAKLQLEADASEKDCVHEESNSLYYESLAHIERVKVQRVADERAGTFRRRLPDGSEVSSYKALYSGKIKQQEALSKELRERQKRIKEHHGPSSMQVNIFNDLHRLLRCKVDLQGQARAEANDMVAANAQDTNIFTMAENDGESNVHAMGGGAEDFY